jgi:hypothetical protein
MPKTYVDVIKQDAKIKVTFAPNDVAELQAILLRDLNKENSLDKESWKFIENLCERIETAARTQGLTESKQLDF